MSSLHHPCVFYLSLNAIDHVSPTLQKGPFPIPTRATRKLYMAPTRPRTERTDDSNIWRRSMVNTGQNNRQVHKGKLVLLPRTVRRLFVTDSPHSGGCTTSNIQSSGCKKPGSRSVMGHRLSELRLNSDRLRETKKVVASSHSERELISLIFDAESKNSQKITDRC